MKQIQLTISLLLLAVSIQVEAKGGLLLLEKPNFNDHSCIEKIAGLYRGEQFGVELDYMENQGDGNFERHWASLSSMCRGSYFELRQPESEPGKIGGGDIQSQSGMLIKKDTYCDKSGRLVVRTMRFKEGGVSSGLFGSPSLTVHYGLTEVVKDNNDQEKIYDSQRNEAYYFGKSRETESNGYEGDFSARDSERIEKAKAENKFSYLKILKSSNEGLPLELAVAKNAADASLLGYVESSEQAFYEYSTAASLLNKDGSLQDFLSEYQKITKDPRLKKTPCGGSR